MTEKRRKGKHLSLRERELIFSLLNIGKSYRQIEEELGLSHGSVGSEIKRNRNQNTFEYLPCKASRKARLRERLQREKAPLKNPEIFLYVKQKLRLGWSPETIAGRIKIDKKDCSITPETIYRFIYDKRKHPHQNLITYLKHAHARRRTCCGRKGKRQLIPARIWIDQRPESVMLRNNFGHFETDLMEGLRTEKTNVSATVERKTRYSLLSLQSDKQAKTKTASILEQLSPFPVNSITTDNGVENIDHQSWSENLNCNVYFTHPYHSWEKGSVENTIGRLRYFLPKGKSLKNLTPSKLSLIQYLMNNTPRKCLNYLTPQEVLDKELKGVKINKWRNSR